MTNNIFKKRSISVTVMLLYIFILSPMILPAAITDAPARLETLGILQGPGTGITEEYLAKPVTRIDCAIFILKLTGHISDAENFTGSDNFIDADQALSDYSRNIMGYLKANPSLGFVGYMDRFDPNSLMTDQMIYKVLLSVLDYRQGTEFEWAETVVMAKIVGMEQIAGKGDLDIEDMCTAVVESLDSEIRETGTLLIQSLVSDGIISIESAHLAGWDWLVSQAES